MRYGKQYLLSFTTFFNSTKGYTITFNLHENVRNENDIPFEFLPWNRYDALVMDDTKGATKAKVSAGILYPLHKMGDIVDAEGELGEDFTSAGLRAYYTKVNEYIQKADGDTFYQLADIIEDAKVDVIVNIIKESGAVVTVFKETQKEEMETTKVLRFTPNYEVDVLRYGDARTSSSEDGVQVRYYLSKKQEKLHDISTHQIEEAENVIGQSETKDRVTLDTTDVATVVTLPDQPTHSRPLEVGSSYQTTKQDEGTVQAEHQGISQDVQHHKTTQVSRLMQILYGDKVVEKIKAEFMTVTDTYEQEYEKYGKVSTARLMNLLGQAASALELDAEVNDPKLATTFQEAVEEGYGRAEIVHQTEVLEMREGSLFQNVSLIGLEKVESITQALIELPTSTESVIREEVVIGQLYDLADNVTTDYVVIHDLVNSESRVGAELDVSTESALTLKEYVTEGEEFTPAESYPEADAEIEETNSYHTLQHVEHLETEETNKVVEVRELHTETATIGGMEWETEVQGLTNHLLFTSALVEEPIQTELVKRVYEMYLTTVSEGLSFRDGSLERGDLTEGVNIVEVQAGNEERTATHYDREVTLMKDEDGRTEVGAVVQTQVNPHLATKTLEGDVAKGDDWELTAPEVHNLWAEAPKNLTNIITEGTVEQRLEEGLSKKVVDTEVEYTADTTYLNPEAEIQGFTEGIVESHEETEYIPTEQAESGKTEEATVQSTEYVSYGATTDTEIDRQTYAQMWVPEFVNIDPVLAISEVTLHLTSEELTEAVERYKNAEGGLPQESGKLLDFLSDIMFGEEFTDTSYDMTYGQTTAQGEITYRNVEIVVVDKGTKDEEVVDSGLVTFEQATNHYKDSDGLSIGQVGVALDKVIDIAKIDGYESWFGGGADIQEMLTESQALDKEITIDESEKGDSILQAEVQLPNIEFGGEGTSDATYTTLEEMNIVDGTARMTVTESGYSVMRAEVDEPTTITAENVTKWYALTEPMETMAPLDKEISLIESEGAGAYPALESEPETTDLGFIQRVFDATRPTVQDTGVALDKYATVGERDEAESINNHEVVVHVQEMAAIEKDFLAYLSEDDTADISNVVDLAITHSIENTRVIDPYAQIAEFEGAVNGVFYEGEQALGESSKLKDDFQVGMQSYEDAYNEGRGSEVSLPKLDLGSDERRYFDSIIDGRYEASSQNWLRFEGYINLTEQAAYGITFEAVVESPTLAMVGQTAHDTEMQEDELSIRMKKKITLPETEDLSSRKVRVPVVLDEDNTASRTVGVPVIIDEDDWSARMKKPVIVDGDDQAGRLAKPIDINEDDQAGRLGKPITLNEDEEAKRTKLKADLLVDESGDRTTIRRKVDLAEEDLGIGRLPVDPPYEELQPIDPMWLIMGKQFPGWSGWNPKKTR